MTKANLVRAACAGGFGHAVCVFSEVEKNPDGIALTGFAPAYPDESIEGFTAHPWAKASGAAQFPTIGNMLEECAPDVLIISTRPDQIPVAARLGLEAGCHLILEKPVALDRTELAALYREAKSRNLRIMGMLSMRTEPAFIAAKTIIESGEIGEPVLVSTRKSYRWGTRPEWFNDRAKYGGTWPWIGIHNLDIAHFLTGRRAVRVQATHMNAAHSDCPKCEDVCTGLFELEGGVRMTATADYCRPANAPTHGDDWARVVGTKGVLEAYGSAGFCKVIGPDGVREIQTGTAPEPIYRPFFDSLKNPDAAYDSTVFHLTDAALAARDSADSGEPVDIDCEQWERT